MGAPFFSVFKDNRIRVMILSFFVTILVGAPIIYFVFIARKSPAAVHEETIQTPVSSFASLEDLQKVDSFNVLLLGYGGAGHEGGFLTDAILIAHVDFTNKKLALISIPRDLWVKLPDGGQGKINAAFAKRDTPEYPIENVSLDDALAGAAKTKSVIEDVTGMTPHFFIGIDFNSFIVAMDKLGGVDVDVPEAFSDDWYPVKGRELELCDHTPEEVTALSNKYSGFELEKQFPCRYERLAFKAGFTHMDGETALKFVRSRHGSSDFSRSLRQQALLIGVRDALLSRKALEDPVGIFKAFSSLIRTNLNENLVKTIAPLIKGVGTYKTINISLKTQNVLNQSTSDAGAFILVPKSSGWAGVQEYIKSELAK